MYIKGYNPAFEIVCVALRTKIKRSDLNSAIRSL